MLKLKLSLPECGTQGKSNILFSHSIAECRLAELAGDDGNQAECAVHVN